MTLPEELAAVARPGERALLVGSSGGHLAQLLALEPWWTDLERAWVTFDTPDARGALAPEKDVTWAFHPTTRNVPNLVRNTRQARSVLRRFRPTVVISTGAAVAYPYFVMTSRRPDVTSVFIEVFDRIDSPTLTGRLVRPFADLVCVQWPEQRALYPDAIEIGPLL
jgi:UDP-N-acetylglucosamine:LPS N-acetylglucosamine transferase